MNVDERRQEVIDKMGQPLGDLYHELQNECAWLHFKWGHYRELFGTSKARVDLMNAVAPECTRVVQDAMWNDVLLHIAKLLDPPVTAGRKTLTIMALPGLSPLHIRPAVSAAVERLKKDARFARDWRHRRLAHLDLRDALGLSAEPLAGPSRIMVQTALDQLGTVLNIVDNHFTGMTFAYGVFSGPDAVGLLLTIRRGHREYEAVKERLKRGDYSGNHWKEDPI